MTFAENIVKFTFKVGDKIRPLTEKKGGGVWRRERSKRARSCWQEPQSRVLEGWSESLTGLQENSKQLEELGREAARVSAPQRRHQRVDFKKKKKTLLVFQTQILLVIFRGPERLRWRRGYIFYGCGNFSHQFNSDKLSADSNGRLKCFHVSVQVCNQHAGADGGGGLHDRVPERRHPPQENARPRLAEEMLPDDRQKAPEESEILHYPASVVVYQDRPRHHQAFHQVVSVLCEAEGLRV